MADEPEISSGCQVGERYVQYLPLSPDGGPANEPLREAINRHVRQGWRLVSVTRHPDGLELVWDRSGS
jgi:hypothetical protein